MDLLTKEQILLLSPDEQREYLTLIEQYEDDKKFNKMNYFKPYPFQKEFYDKGKEEKVRGIICANRVGKTHSACMEIAYHMTGDYPEWWEGRRWDRPIKVIACSYSSKQVKMSLQTELVGTENRDFSEAIGTGTIPKSAFTEKVGTKGRDGAYDDLFVNHKSGGVSTLTFFSYEAGVMPLMGFTADLVYVDEQDRNKFDEVFGELIKRTMSVDGSTIAAFTPLQGFTHVVNEFWREDGKFHSGLTRASWDDVDHLSDEAKKITLAATPPHLQDAVSKGIPTSGSGAVFAIHKDKIVYDGVEIGDNWPKICGVDVGFTNDPTAAIFLAKEPSTGIYYIYDEYGDVNNNILSASDHVGQLHAKNCGSIPMIYDTAANRGTGSPGGAMTEMWSAMGLNVLPQPFRNPESMAGGRSSHNKIAPGLVKMYELMNTGKLKVHNKCKNWWREFDTYTYDKNGIPSGKDNHWMDASRYAVLSAERGLMEVIGEPSWATAYYDHDGEDHFFQTY